MTKRIITMNVIKGEPLDGTGRVCIHLFVRDSSGPFVEPHALHPVIRNGEAIKQQLVAKPARGRLACDPNRKVAPVTRNGVTTITPRSDDPRAVTCPRCMASSDYEEMMRQLDMPVSPS